MVRDRLSIVARKTWMACRPKSDFERASADGGKDAPSNHRQVGRRAGLQASPLPCLAFLIPSSIVIAYPY